MTLAVGTFVDRNTVRFELDYPHPPAAVWNALVDPDAVRVWFMPMDIELRVGGRVVLWDTDEPGFEPARGVVTACETNALLEYRFEAGPWRWPASTLRFEVSAVDEGSRLVFTQQVAPDTVWGVDPEGQVGGIGTIHPGACAGWEGFFREGLARFLDGQGAPLYDDADDEMMASRTTVYRDLITATLLEL